MLDLPNVTLVAIFGVAHELSMLAVEECCSRANFRDVRLFTDQPKHDVIRAWRSRYIDKMYSSVEAAGPFKDFLEAGLFTTYEVPGYINTSHALFIHWDSWITNPDMWTDDFLQYDYIGAPWWYQDGYNVGNSGFCLRSKRLIDFLAAHEEQFPIRMPEDNTLCRQYRRHLPQFQWAPERVAHQFSFERVRLLTRSFGFHGVFNFARVMDDTALARRVEMIRRDPYARSRPEYSELEASVIGRVPEKV